MKTDKQGCDLRSCFLCTTCMKEWLPAVGSHRETLLFKKGEVIFREGIPVSGIYFLNSGKVKVHQHWGEGKELIVRLPSPGTILGHRGLGDSLIYPVSATALEACSVCFIGLDFFYTTLKVNADFSFRLLMFFAEELHDSERKMRNQVHMPVKGRLAQALLFLKERFGCTENGSLAISLSRQDLAAYVGVAYETVFRTMNELEAGGLIQLEGKDIVLADVLALTQLAEQQIKPGV